MRMGHSSNVHCCSVFPFSCYMQLCTNFCLKKTSCGVAGYFDLRSTGDTSRVEYSWKLDTDACSKSFPIFASGKFHVVNMVLQLLIGMSYRPLHLQVYASMLYLHVPENFQIILCGRAVEPHYVINDLIYRECIKYRPQVEVTTEVCSTRLDLALLGCGPILHSFPIWNDCTLENSY